MRRFPFRIEIVSMHRPDRPGAFSTVFTARDSESLAVTYDIMATARLVVDLNTGFAFVRNVENSPLHLTVD